MSKNLMSLVNDLEKKNKLDQQYDSFANSTIIEQEINKLQNKAKNTKISLGIVNSSGNNIRTSNVISNNNDGKISAVMGNVTQQSSDITIRNSEQISTTDNNNIFFHNVTEKKVTEPTFVFSDPVKPDITSQSTVSTIQPFNVNNLYSDISKIDLSENTYVDISTGKTINKENITSFSDEGIIIETSNSEDHLPSYQLISTDQISQNNIKETSDFTAVTPYQFKDTVIGQSFLHEKDINGDIYTKNETDYRYLYCFDKIAFENRLISPVAGFISQPIKISEGSYVELDVETTDYVEYSIIDGKDEIPILPRNVEVIKNEELFFGIMPRFVIDNPDDITVKRDDLQIGITTLKELEIFLAADTSSNQSQESSYNNDHIYTITYKPVLSSQRYFPKNTEVRVKVIQRYLGVKSPKSLGQIVLLQSKANSSWYLSSYQQDEDYNPWNPIFRR